MKIIEQKTISNKTVSSEDILGKKESSRHVDLADLTDLSKHSIEKPQLKSWLTKTAIFLLLVASVVPQAGCNNNNASPQNEPTPNARKDDSVENNIIKNKFFQSDIASQVDNILANKPKDRLRVENNVQDIEVKSSIFGYLYVKCNGVKRNDVNVLRADSLVFQCEEQNGNDSNFVVFNDCNLIINKDDGTKQVVNITCDTNKALVNDITDTKTGKEILNEYEFEQSVVVSRKDLLPQNITFDKDYDGKVSSISINANDFTTSFKLNDDSKYINNDNEILLSISGLNSGGAQLKVLSNEGTYKYILNPNGDTIKEQTLSMLDADVYSLQYSQFGSFDKGRATLPNNAIRKEGITFSRNKQLSDMCKVFDVSIQTGSMPVIYVDSHGKVNKNSVIGDIPQFIKNIKAAADFCGYTGPVGIFVDSCQSGSTDEICECVKELSNGSFYISSQDLRDCITYDNYSFFKAENLLGSALEFSKILVQNDDNITVTYKGNDGNVHLHVEDGVYHKSVNNKTLKQTIEPLSLSTNEQNLYDNMAKGLNSLTSQDSFLLKSLVTISTASNYGL